MSTVTVFAENILPGTSSQTQSKLAAMLDPKTNSPYLLNLLYTGEPWENAVGGIRQGFSYMNNADAKLMIDAERAYGWKNTQLVVEVFYENAVSTGNNWVGAVDQQSPIDTALNRSMPRLYQAFFDKNFGKTDVLFGIFDVETEFSQTKPMSLFLSKDLTWNTAFDQAGTMPQNGSIGPGNYPYPVLALRLRQQVVDKLSVQGVVANAASENPSNPQKNAIRFSSDYGALFVGEADYTPKKNTKIMFGVWGLTSKLPANNGIQSNGDQRYIWGQEGIPNANEFSVFP